MATKKVVPGSLTQAYKKGEGDFSPNLVGLQFASNGGTPLFTFGNFAITTNIEPRIAKDFKLGEWSEEYCLVDLNLNEQQSEQLVSNRVFVNLNFNKRDLSRYVYYGSFVKFLESEITDTLSKWPASLYVKTIPNGFASPLNTVLSFSHNSTDNTSKFVIPVVAIENKFGLTFSLNEGTTIDLDNIQVSFTKYVIYNNNTEYSVLGYTGSTESNQYLSVITKGNPFPSLSGNTFGQINYHLKPDSLVVEEYFSKLTDFQGILLDRLVNPIYTATFDTPFKTDLGTIVYTTKSYTWPTADGYNLDTDTVQYQQYLDEIFSMAKNFDDIKTNLISRRFVSESIHEFDTEGDGDGLTGMKISKMLKIYGREYDVVKKYIDGISFANVVTYDKRDNTSDNLIKYMAKTLGFDTLLSLGTDSFNVLDGVTPGTSPQFDGYSRELSPQEMDTELWRRLVINAWWLFKSKGTRKVLEFFLRIFGINECLVDLNECVYVADNTIMVGDTIRKLAELTNSGDLNIDTQNQPFDSFGFPKILPDTPGYYFQNDGFWYNGGTERTTGNNPHFGTYDFGQRYFDKFRCFIDGFETTLINNRIETTTTNFFKDFNDGSFSPDENGAGVAPYGVTIPPRLLNNDDNAEIISAGLVTTNSNDGPKVGRVSGDTYSMRITFTAGEAKVCDPCPTSLVWNNDGLVYVQSTDVKGELITTPLKDENCCDTYWLPLTQGCPEPGQTTVNTDGYINEITSPECCTSEITQVKDFYWDGVGCKLGKLPAGSGTPTTESVTTLDSKDIFRTPFPPQTQGEPDGSIPGTNTNSYYCWWCPPTEHLATVCSPEEFLVNLNLDDTGILNKARANGYIGNDIGQATQFLLTLLSTYFKGSNCIIMVPSSSDVLTNTGCCNARGGTWSEVDKLCTVTQSTTCNPLFVQESYNNTSIVVTTVGKTPSVLDQSCCQSLGYYYGGSKGLSITALDGTVTTIPFSQQTIDTLLTLGSVTQFCSICPFEIKATTINGKDIFTDLNDNPIDQKCCELYGYTYLDGYGCLVCKTDNIVVSSGTYEVTYNIGGVTEPLTQSCCESLGYYYDVSSKVKIGCFLCPQNYTLTNTTIGGSSYTIVTDTSGRQLTNTCCTDYANKTNNTTAWNTTVGCYLSSGQAQTK